ncbi:arylsulfatase A-like enzyme [Chryseobacterium vietnamense]|uniref:sulfatase n=1 Tax=Chryseobacterium vietnamense TaxID=866785 RepID=UPI0028599C08|nr:sulfatase [Chryseobacterium vietnamense]MDR6488523.1 arylsulfatase A-like enzyme [Chryseobacterium vietnamense]
MSGISTFKSKSISILLLLILPFTIITGQSQKRSKPNVIFIVVDDLRPELGVYGNSTIKTPNIDKLAGRGTTFTNAYCQVAVCAPSRASALTGLRPDSTKVWVLGEEFRKIHPDVVTIPQQFEKFNYHTVSIGKIFHNHMPDSISFREPDLRPDGYALKNMVDRDPESFYFSGELKTELAAKRLERLAKDPKRYGNGWAYGRSVEVANCPDDSLYDGAQTSLAIQTINRVKNKKKPFFLALGYFRPHLPFVAPKKYWDLYDPMEIPMADNNFIPFNAPSMAMYNQREMTACYDLEYVKHPAYFRMPEKEARMLKHGYYASVSYVDACIGRLVDELEKQKLLDNTIIVLWGDHGWKLGEHNAWGKQTNYLNDTRVPLIVYAPGMKNPGSKSNELVEMVDLYPTLCDLAGIETPSYLQGVSFKKLLNENSVEWKGAVFSQFLRPAGEGIDLNKKSYMGYSMVTKSYHLIEWYYWDKVTQKPGELVARELYNLTSDPKENFNIAMYPENKDILEKLSEQRKKGWKEVKNKLVTAQSTQ